MEITAERLIAQAKEEEIVRFDIHQRVQHFLMMTSVFLLAVTGLPLKFADLGISQWWIGVWGGIDVTRWVHHFFAWVMVLDCIYHLIYVGYTTIALKRPFSLKIIPTPKDFFDFYGDMAYFFGFAKERPKYDRFNWREKFDYWAIFWGMFIIGGSGAILMFPVLASKFLPGWSIPAALIAHGDEAMLAVIWIFIVHIFFNHFTPDYFPLNKSIFTGKLTRNQYQHEHPLDYERLGVQPEPAPAKTEDGGPPMDGGSIPHRDD
ncbi:MAG: cytochrome b/b6 domain-containing protein [Chloroflexota bacterium]